MSTGEKERKEREPCCADCKYHNNRPSWCTVTAQFVPRKKSMCKEGRKSI